MKRSLITATLITIVTTSVIGFAQPVGPADPAEVAYQEGKRLYDIQDWDQAIAKFKEAYRLRSDAASLFNIAQSFRLKGDCSQAITFYKTYKRNFPTAENLPKVEKFIADLEAACPKGPPPTNPPPTGPLPTGTPPTDTPPTGASPGIATPPDPAKPDPILKADLMPPPPGAHGDAGRTKRLVGYTLLGVGGASLITGVAFGLSARSKSNTVETTSGIAWDPSVETAGQHAERNSRILLGVGAAAVIGGGVLVLLGHSAGGEASTVSLAPTTAGGSFVWSGTW